MHHAGVDNSIRFLYEKKDRWFPIWLSSWIFFRFLFLSFSIYIFFYYFILSLNVFCCVFYDIAFTYFGWSTIKMAVNDGVGWELVRRPFHLDSKFVIQSKEKKSNERTAECNGNRKKKIQHRKIREKEKKQKKKRKEKIFKNYHSGQESLVKLKLL